METEVSNSILKKAAEENGINAAKADLIRNGSHAMWAIPGGIVGRVGERGSENESAKEVMISRWLNSRGIRTVRVIDEALQPTIIDDHPVTWWELLPEHRPASPVELGETLRRLHDLHDWPKAALPNFSAFGSARQRLKGLQGFSHELAWMEERMDVLERRLSKVALSVPSGVIHGDAWQGNVVVVNDRDTIILDLEAFCIGPTFWDLIPIAVDHTDFSRITDSEYEGFAAAYGFDVTMAAEYRTLADVQETRWTAYVLSKANQGSAEGKEARHRIACLQGDIPRPWRWKAF